ncbi:MAG: hypothetical protein ACK48X_17710, partial [Planctomycetota bacterium]
IQTAKIGQTHLASPTGGVFQPQNRNVNHREELLAIRPGYRAFVPESTRKPPRWDVGRMRPDGLKRSPHHFQPPQAPG